MQLATPSLCALLAVGLASPGVQASRHRFTVDGTQTLLDGQPFLARGLRCSNAVISDDAAAELVANLDNFAGYGVNTISVFFQGSRFGDVVGYREDASLDPAYAARMGRVIEAADARGMVVLVGCLYWGNSRGKWEHWTQTEANTAVANTVRWLAEHGYRNTFVDVDNEGMALAAKGFDNRALVLAGKAVDSTCVMATNFHGDPPPEADMGIHHSNQPVDRPYVESEGSPHNAPGGYWGAYSKREDLYNYLNIGVYTAAMQTNQCQLAAEHFDRGQGYLLASTWLQCVAPAGPNHRAGGLGTADDPGVRWWLEWLRDRFGAYQPPQ